MPRAVALFSGGLDSVLAVRILQEQGFEVDALHVRTVFQCCAASAAPAAANLGVRLHVVDVDDDYLDLIRRPEHGYGKAVNPCVDCRLYMARTAKRWMEQLGACLVATGEVLGQREMSQKRLDLDLIAERSKLGGRLLRPLSAKLLAPTIPEREGLIDRDRLYDFNGRGRRAQIELAARLGVQNIPTPSGGCRLAEVGFAPRVRDLLRYRPNANRWEFEILSIGRHLRFDAGTKVVIGRNCEQNMLLEQFFDRAGSKASALLIPASFSGPHGMVLGEIGPEAIALTGALMLRFARCEGGQQVRLRLPASASEEIVAVQAMAAAAEYRVL